MTRSSSAPICLIVLFCALLTGCGASGTDGSVEAGAAVESFVLHDAVIYTVDPTTPTAEAFAVVDGRIAAVGTTDEVFEAHPDLERISAGGRTVVPGFIDAHAHLMDLGIEQMDVDLRGTESVDAAVERIRMYRRANPGQEWITGRGWNQELWPQPEFPTRADLDEAFPDVPIWLERVDGHAGWANTAALEAAGYETIAIADDTEGGTILRDQRGEPTGIFVDEAMSWIQDALPVRDDAWYDRALTLALRKTASVGLTGVHDAGDKVNLETLDRYRRFIDQGRFPLRVYAMIGWEYSDAVERYCNDHLIDYGDRLTVRSVKMYVDGALGSRGAALIEPYSDDPGNLGLVKMGRDSLAVSTERALDCGYQVNSHAIGDRANRIALDVYETKDADPEGRHRIEHAQIVHPDDIPRFKQLGVIAAMQPTHATSDLNMAEDRVGPDRIRGGYAWRTFLEQGTPLAFGSDFAVEKPDPLLGFFAAVTRQTEDLFPEGGWYAEQAVTREEALHGFTLGAAYSAFQEAELGSISPNKRADFVVLSDDIMTIDAPRILETEVVATVLGGDFVHGGL
ncbi:MAG: amidohydrolase [Rhodothermales bacterium]|nr:amidohydrolase [Rhodothermales bacterium]